MSDRLKRHNLMKVRLAKYHRIFSTLHEFSSVTFTEKSMTACVVSDIKKDKPIQFIFGTEFFDLLTDNQLEFVYCHEMEHIILKHASRTGSRNLKIANVAKDIVINEFLIEQFNFDRDEIKAITGKCKATTCLYDTFLEKGTYKKGGNFEYYYNLLLSKAEKVSTLGGTIDEHGSSDTQGDKDLEEILDKALNKLNLPELENLKNSHKTISSDTDLAEKVGRYIEKRQASLTNLETKFKSTIKNIEEKYAYDWRKENVYMTTFRKSTSVVIPYNHRVQFNKNQKQILYAFLDTSGSCNDLADRFFNLVDGIDTAKWDVKLYGFNTVVYEIINRTVYAGGTYFHIIEEFLRTLPKYPDSVLMITDGYGNDVVPAFPENWTVFLTEDAKHCFPLANQMKFEIIK